MSEQQLNLCKQLYQATLACKGQCERLVPAAFNGALLEALQHVMLLAVQLQQEEQLQGVRACLEAALQLLSRVGSLGPIEAFFVADELLLHYQSRVDATHSLLCRLGAKRPCCAADKSAKAAAAATGAAAEQQQQAAVNAGACPKCQLKLPEQHQQIVQTFRRQAAKLCPVLVQSCPSGELQQLCDTVKQGLVLVNGHSFLLGQEWHAEVSAMLARAEQLKVLLAHRQAHHLSLLASVLQYLHQQEVQQYDLPRSSSCSSPSKRPQTPAVSLVQHDPGQSISGPRQVQPQQEVVAGGLISVFQQQQVPAQAALRTEFHGVGGSNGVDLDQDDDDFFLPVAPLAASASGSPDGSPSNQPQAGLPSLPFHVAAAAPQGSGGVTSHGDSLARTPSSGCSSLMEYVHSAMSPGPHAARDSATSSAGGSPTGSPSLLAVEQQLLSIAGSPEVAAVLASALGYEQRPCSQASSRAGGLSSAGGALLDGIPAASAGSFTSFIFSGGRSGQSSPGHSRPASVLGRLSSSTSKALEGFAMERASISGLVPRQQQRRRWQRPQKASSTLKLQHVQLPTSFCRSVGAVCYVSPHLKRIALVDVGLTDQDVGDLVDALKVNSNIQHLDLSQNMIEDIGARVLAILLKPSAGSSSRLRTLCLQHNQIDDDGAAALAAGLASSTRLQRLWLQHNAIGEAGATALCKAMRHNTACVDLKLHPGNEDVPGQLAQTVEQLARQNRGARDHIKGLLQLVHWTPSQ